MPNQDSLEDHEASRSQSALRAVRSHVQSGSLPMLLVTSLILYVLNGLAADSKAGAILVLVGRAGVTFASLYVLSAHRVTLWLGVLVVGPVITFEARLWALDPRVSRVLDLMTTGFLLWVLVVVLREVFRRTTGERDAVFGALCGFLIILTVFMRLHNLLEALFPGSYHTDVPPLSERSDTMLVAIFQYSSTSRS